MEDYEQKVKHYEAAASVQFHTSQACPPSRGTPGTSCGWAASVAAPSVPGQLESLQCLAASTTCSSSACLRVHMFTEQLPLSIPHGS